jgi:predicted transcriptional regulator
VQISPEFPVTSTADFFTKLGLRYVLVTDQGQLKGLITKKDMIVYLDDKMQNNVDMNFHHATPSS